mmetsp:Transcript_8081/g.17503  ORF Transcript_8081/g.17503 Transcript_8081/m.17503 type:complete len:135 (+) Transcript_8081:938-1342(+)
MSVVAIEQMAEDNASDIKRYEDTLQKEREESAAAMEQLKKELAETTDILKMEREDKAATAKRLNSSLEHLEKELSDATTAERDGHAATISSLGSVLVLWRPRTRRRSRERGRSTTSWPPSTRTRRRCTRTLCRN